MKLLVVEDEALRHRLGATSHEHVLRKFGYQRLVDDMSRLYHELLDKKAK